MTIWEKIRMDFKEKIISAQNEPVPYLQGKACAVAAYDVLSGILEKLARGA